MKFQEFLALTPSELYEKKKEFKKELLNLRFQKKAGKSVNTARFTILRRGVARIETALTCQKRSLSKGETNV